jgi:KUP system potassium uptake protein
MTTSDTRADSQNDPIAEVQAEAHHQGFWGLTLGSIGVVFGDIGTSPLYAFREAVHGAAHGGQVTPAIVLGVLSLIVWALFIVVTAKYVLLLLRADNNGEGGSLSLMALGQRALGQRSIFLLVLGVIGASMFIADSMITPAISVLSAVEGLKYAAPALEPYVIPLTVVILIMLFSVQRGGTAKVAAFFGPIMAIWFSVIAVLGLMHISDAPYVLSAINPWYAVHFMLNHGTVISGASRSSAAGCSLCCRRCSSIISGRALWSCPIRRPSRIRFIEWHPISCSCHSLFWRLLRL